MRFLIKGVALEPHAETLGASGVEKEWPEDELKEAVDTLVGRPVTKTNSTAAENVVGQVTDAEWKDGEGVVYEAEIEDEEVAQKIQESQGELAPRLFHEAIGTAEIDESEEPQVVEDIQFDTLFLTPQASDGVPGVTEIIDTEDNND